MHPYSTDASDRKHVPPIIAVVSVVAAIILNFVLKTLKLEFMWWFDAPSVMGFYVISHWLFNKWVWKFKNRSLRLSSIPNINGSWKGYLTSSHKEEARIEAALFIRQTWTEMIVELETVNSKSTSTMAALNTNNHCESGLQYEFRNEPKTFAVETMQIFRGMAHLHVLPDEIQLKGDYYTGRGRRSIGDLSFKLISRETMSFEDVANYIDQQH